MAWLSREVLLAVAAVLGLIRPFQLSAQQSLLPTLVPSKLLPRALAFGSAGAQVAVMVGPAVGGLLLLLGPGAAYAGSLVLHVAASLLLLGVTYTHAPTLRERLTWASLLAGVHFLRRRNLLLAVMSLDLLAVVFGSATALFPVYARDVLAVGPEGLGLLRAAQALGAMTMAVALSRWPPTRNVGRILVTAVVLFGASTTLFGLSTSLPLSLVALAAVGASDMLGVVIRQAIIQIETPDELRGRVGAINSLNVSSSNQLGEFESGAVAAVLGPTVSVVSGGVAAVGIALGWWRIFPELRERDRIA